MGSTSFRSRSDAPNVTKVVPISRAECVTSAGSAVTHVSFSSKREVHESSGKTHWERLYSEVYEDGKGEHPSLPGMVGEPAPASRVSMVPVTNTYAKMSIVVPPGTEHGPEMATAASRLLKCLDIRKKYAGYSAGQHMEPSVTQHVSHNRSRQDLNTMMADIDGDSFINNSCGHTLTWDPLMSKLPPADPSLTIHFEDGIFVARSNLKLVGGDRAVISVDEFCRDYVQVLQTMRDRSCISFCVPRLRELDLSFEFHMNRNAVLENEQASASGGRDWFSVRKVDTHIHHSAAFSQKHLMSFIRRKMRDEMDTLVLKDGDRVLTLREVFSCAGLTEDTVTADRLCCMASMGACGQHDTFGRFDRFNNKYNPFGDKRLRDIFLKTDNFIEGRYMAELTKELMTKHEADTYVFAEWRISIYGRDRGEWARLARWFRKHEIKSRNIRWLIQVPRLYSLFRKMGVVRSFGHLLSNVFEPLFEDVQNPSSDMFYMLQQLVGFDSVDDESQDSHLTLKVYPPPDEWTSEANPPYSYWMFHMYANIRSLNAARRHRGMHTFTYRPHCGEAGNVSHLVSGFMLADSICHGVKLIQTPVLQYLFYLAQVGLAVSPLSNDILFVPLAESPFGNFFRTGLNVSLSTDDPLIIHMTEEPLVEEYVVAARTFRLSLGDLCEIARNSVRQSNFESSFKEFWIGKCNDAARSNVSNTRLQFRADCLAREFEVLREAKAEL